MYLFRQYLSFKLRMPCMSIGKFVFRWWYQLGHVLLSPMMMTTDYMINHFSLKNKFLPFYNGWFNDHDSSSMSIVIILQQDVSENYGYLDDKLQDSHFSTDCLIRSKPIIFTTFHFPITYFPTSCCAVQHKQSVIVELVKVLINQLWATQHYCLNSVSSVNYKEGNYSSYR